MNDKGYVDLTATGTSEYKADLKAAAALNKVSMKDLVRFALDQIYGEKFERVALFFPKSGDIYHHNESSKTVSKPKQISKGKK